jgi:putative FmdB family regulatory protein
MPIYEYACSQCGRIEEAIQKFSDAPLTTCRHCSGELTRLISQSSFHLKGAGWFADGYGAKSKGKEPVAPQQSAGTGSAESKKPSESTQKNKA